MTAELVGSDPLADIFASVGLGGNQEKDNKKSNDKKKRTPVDVTYEGFTIRQISPTRGEKKSWDYCTSNPLPFDSAKLYSMGNAHKLRIGKDAMAVYRELSAEQQALIDRVVAMKNTTESNNDAIWEPFDIRRIKKDVQRSLFTVDRIVVALELIVKRKDRTTGLTSDRPTGTTTNPHKISGQVLDLNLSMDEFLKQVGGKNKNGNKQKDKKSTDVVDSLDIAELLGGGGGSQQQQQHHQQPPPPPQHHRHTEPPVNPDPEKYFWNGQFFEEKSPQMLHEEHVARQREREHLQHMRQEEFMRRRQQEELAAQEHAMRQQQAHNHQVLQAQQAEIERQNAIIHQQRFNPRVPPAVPMAPGMRAHPFAPLDGRAGQFAVLDEGEALEYVERQRTRSRSRPGYRNASRHHSRHRYPPSMGSSEEDSWYEETPPSSPPRSVGSLHRRRNRGVRYQGEERPALVYKHVREIEAHPRRPALIHDDYPPRTRRLTGLSEGLHDAEFSRPRRDRRQSAYDILETAGRSRYDRRWD